MRRALRDPAPAVLAGLLALLALPATGWVAVPWLPSTPAGYGALACTLSAIVLLAAGAAGRPVRVLTLVLGAAPALVFATLDGAEAPGLGWWFVLGAAGVLAAVPVRRTVVSAVVVGLLAVVAVFEGADAGRLVGVRSDDIAADAPPPRELRTGVRVGAPLRAPDDAPTPLGSGIGPWWLEAERASHPGPRPVVLVAGAESAPGDSWSMPRATIVPGSAWSFDAAHALRSFDVVVVNEDAWGADDPLAPARARAVEGFVRGGGLLLGPAPDRPWPPQLGPRLGSAGRSRLAGTGGVRTLGMGRIARTATQQDVAEIFDADLWVRDARTPLLDVGTSRPPPLEGWAPWTDDPGSRRTHGLLLGLHALALLVAARLVTGRAAQLTAAVVATGVVAGALAWTAPQDPGYRVAGAFVEFGGAGGRRVEGVWISAGPRGYRGHVRFQGEGVVGLRGARLDADGRVVVAPGRSAWVVRETRGRGVQPDEPEDRTQGAVLALVRGPVDPGRLRVVRRDALPVRVEGWGPVPAGGVLVRGADR